MATPVGHMLMGASTLALSGPRRARARLVALGALVGAAPDLDFLPGLVLGDPARFHHGPTHSLGFALLAALATWLLASRQRGRWALAVALAYASHLLLDLLTEDPSPPHGIPLLWPWSDAYLLSPITPLPRVLHSSVSPFNLHNLLLGATELLVFGALLAACLRIVGPAPGGATRESDPSGGGT